jgi:nucleoid-associated protein YgaU
MTMQSTRLEKAYLALVKPPSPANKPPALSQIQGSARGQEIVFTFNPKEFSISKSATWKRTGQRGAKTAAMPQFTGSAPATLTVEVFLDSSEEKNPSVAPKVQKLLDAVTPLQKTVSENNPSPPWVVFGWGRFMSFVAVLKQVNAKYTMFRSDGTPIRATASLTLEEVPTTPPPRQNPTSGALTAHRSHTVVAGDTLQSIAYAEYSDPARWRDLAEVNGIDDPMRLPPGTPLLVPSITELED